MTTDSDSIRPEIEYPCEWHYKVIGTDVEAMIGAIEIITEGMDCKLSSSNISSGGKYYSLNLTVVVASEAERNLIFAELESSESIRIVL